MKPTLLLSCLLVLGLSACALFGGQSGDDGDATRFEPPGEPDPCEPEELEVDLAAPTLFGASALELVSRVAPAGEITFFWVPYDSLPGTTFVPGPGQASLTLGIEARTGERATHLDWPLAVRNRRCPEDTLSVPVHVTLQTSDAALDERFDTEVVFTSASVAHLEINLAARALNGTFAFQQIGAPEDGWQAEDLYLSVDLWPGGSRGEILPSFTRTTPPTPPGPGVPPPTLSEFSIEEPAVPEHWWSVAVWPRREACYGQAAYLVEDKAFGWSIADAVRTLMLRSNRTLTLAGGMTAVQLRVEEPLGLQCVRPGRGGMAFNVRATLVAESSAAPALEHLAASSVFDITATGARDGSGLETLRWERREAGGLQSRSAFEAATGLTLDAPDEYQRFAWSWHGSDTRESTSMPWAAQGAFVVSSLNLAQEAEVARIMALGGPGAGVILENDTGFPTLPGDVLIKADIMP